VCSAPEAKGDGLGKGFRDFLWLPGGHNGLVFVLSYENHEGKDLAVMFLLVLVLLLLFSLSKFGFWSLGKIGWWWYHPGQSGRFQRARLSLMLGLRPRP
jgi:hypothetical protein